MIPLVDVRNVLSRRSCSAATPVAFLSEILALLPSSTLSHSNAMFQCDLERLTFDMSVCE